MYITNKLNSLLYKYKHNSQSFNEILRDKLLLPRVISLYSSKFLFYIGCKVWEEIPKSLKKLNYLIAFQSGLNNVILKNHSDKCLS